MVRRYHNKSFLLSWTIGRFETNGTICNCQELETRFTSNMMGFTSQGSQFNNVDTITQFVCIDVFDVSMTFLYGFDLTIKNVL